MRLICRTQGTKNHAFAWLFKWLPTARLPIKFLTEFFCRPGSRFLPCAPGVLTRTNKNIAPPFSPYRRQSSLPALGLPLLMLATTHKQCGLINQQSAVNLPHAGHKKPRFRVAFQMAPRVGLEPTTYRLTAGRSTIELSGKNLFFKLLILAT